MKGSVLKKFLCTCLVTAAAFAATTISASACTTIYVGGDLVEEGTPFVARTEDYCYDYNKLWFISESGKWKQGDHYVGCPEYGPFEWDFTHDSYRFTYFTNDIYYDGICPECGEKADHFSYTEFGTNEKGVSVSATETLYGNEKVTEADPYRDAEWAEANKSERIGIEETDIPTIILAEASSAREGVKLLLDIYENYGCVAASGVFVCDKDEVWYVENCSGTQYVAIKLNNNMIFLEPNMAVIGRVDLDDENVIASKDLIAVAKKAGTFVGDEAKNIIDFRASYARISEKMDQRMIDGLNYLNAAYKYDSDALVADNTKFTISNLDASDKLVALYTNIKADRKLVPNIVRNYLVIRILLNEAYLRRGAPCVEALFRHSIVCYAALPRTRGGKLRLYLAYKRCFAAAGRARQQHVFAFVYFKRCIDKRGSLCARICKVYSVNPHERHTAASFISKIAPMNITAANAASIAIPPASVSGAYMRG